MRDTTLKFKNHKLMWGEYIYQLAGDREGLIRVCPNGLSDYFKIPKTAKTIFIKLSEKPTKESYKVHTLPHTTGVGVIDSQSNREWKMLFAGTKRLLKQIVGTAQYFYVSVEYS